MHCHRVALRLPLFGLDFSSTSLYFPTTASFKRDELPIFNSINRTFVASKQLQRMSKWRSFSVCLNILHQSADSNASILLYLFPFKSVETGVNREYKSASNGIICGKTIASKCIPVFNSIVSDTHLSTKDSSGERMNYYWSHDADVTLKACNQKSDLNNDKSLWTNVCFFFFFF